MALFDMIKSTFSNREQIMARIEQLKQKDKDGQLSARGKLLLEKLRSRYGK